MNWSSDMRKGVSKQSLAAEILMDCRNSMLAAQNLKLKYYGTVTSISPIFHSTTHLNPFIHNCSYIKLLICGNLRFTRNVATKGFELFSLLVLISVLKLKA
jgi:hypothetical protein